MSQISIEEMEFQRMSRDNLAFLDKVLGSRSSLYRESKWLISDFDNNVWYFKIESPNVGSFQIDFNVALSNGTVLTGNENKRLLNTFKYWINASVHPDNTKGRGFAYADSTAKNILVKVVYLIDYLLINDKHLNISTCGLQALTGDNLRHFSDRQATNKLAAEHVYNWTEKLSEFLLQQVASTDEEQPLILTKLTGVNFTAIPDDQIEINELKIPVDLIPLVRCWLWENGFYRKATGGEFIVNTTRLSELLYGKTTLRGAAASKPCPRILNLGEFVRSEHEYPRVPVSSDDDITISFTGIKEYKTALSSLFLLADDTLSGEGLLIPPANTITAFLECFPKNAISNRFVTLPSTVLLSAVRDAIEFHIQHAAPLIKSLRNVLHLLSKKRLLLKEGSRTSISKVISPKEFSGLLHPDIRRIGVRKWSISKEENRFEALRKNIGLSELIRVYYGCVQIVVGALMARRQIELLELKAGSCLDERKLYLVFGKAKSTRLLEGRKVDVARPIDEMAVEMIEKLTEIHEIYVEMGLIKQMGNLFDNVSLQDPSEMISVIKYKHSFAQNLDFFCDYFETPLRDGKRFYIRMHQLRRFFALSFFWGSGFGGMDTLRWFMGHTDPQHLYRYITENTPGEVLRHAKSQFLAETIVEHTELRELIFERFGTVDFIVLTTGDLEEYIDELILDGEVDVEPEFIVDGEGESYKLLIIIRDKYDA